jgi:hypothetical protein
MLPSIHFLAYIDTNTDISVSAIWISVLAISLSALVSATLDFCYFSIGQIFAQIHGYRPKYRHISAKIPVIDQISAKMKISVSVADMLVRIYRYRQTYRLGEYIGIGWNHIGSTLRIGTQ